MKGKNLDTAWVSALSIATLLVAGYLYFHYFTPEWKGHQAEFRNMVEQRFGPARAAQVPSGIQQVWIPQLNRTDRCVTCHLGVEWKGLERAPEPYRSHPKGILEKHPVARYGCTTCHGGQGYAVTAEAAHATEIQHWESPVLGKQMARMYSVSNRLALLETHCNACHRYERETKGLEYINHARQLVRDKGCRACHAINGRGGVIGPNLTRIGEQSAEQYEYSRLSGRQSVFAWHLAHFKNPKQMAAESVMPNFNFGSKDSQALTLLVMSWKPNDYPPEYLPGLKFGDFPTQEEIEKEQRMLSGEGAFFVKKGCFICHEVSSLGIESAAKIGPDLALAVTDVQSRFGVTVDDFIKRPTGTMAVVLATQIQLTDAEKAEVIQKLQLAYQRKREQAATAAPSAK